MLIGIIASLLGAIGQALNYAVQMARPGQAILLSPACASFDQFKGFEERGRVFVNLVRHLKADEE